MPRRVLTGKPAVFAADGVAIRAGVRRLQDELGVTPVFSDEVLAQAQRDASDPRLPSLDRTDLPLVTLDPASARDLDQAVHLERRGSGYRVFYAIADVAAFLGPGGELDAEVRRRGETLYGVGAKVPLHPTILSEGAASLLPDVDRPALLWTIDVDEAGEATDIDVTRAMVRSRAKLSYDGVQADLDADRADPVFALLRELGELRQARGVRRGAVTLPLPDQEVDLVDGRWRLSFRKPLPVEGWNAEMSLLTGMSAARLMVEARIGILRTVPAPDPRDVERLRRVAQALGIDWKEAMTYPELIGSLDASDPADAALLTASTSLLRGAGYVAFDGEVPQEPEHAALASIYTHCTAPLRRLVDRFTGEVCVSLRSGIEVPDWVRQALGELPELMTASSRRAGAYERGVVDLVEAVVLEPRVGEVFDASVVSVDDRDPRKGEVMVPEPAIAASVSGETPLPLGEHVRVRLSEADVERRAVRFELVRP